MESQHVFAWGHFQKKIAIIPVLGREQKVAGQIQTYNQINRTSRSLGVVGRSTCIDFAGRAFVKDQEDSFKLKLLVKKHQ